MASWEEALAAFLENWKERDDVIGAMVCGSYVTGHPSPRSDIDLHIILANEVDWRERGNAISQGYLIEYFANPPKQIRAYFQEDFNDKSTMSMVQFVTGKVIFDPTGVIEELKSEANAWLSKQHPVLNDTVIELKKYAIWDALDNLKDCYEQGRGDFQFTYYISLHKLFEEYSAFLSIEAIPFYQISRYLTDPIYIDKYVKKQFPDKQFSSLFIGAMQKQEASSMMKSYEVLVDYVHRQMGGFELDGWKVKSDLDL